MRKLRLRLPAAVTPLDGVGLALRLYSTVEISERRDHDLTVTMDGDGAFSTPLLHPVVRAMMRVFQQAETTRLGASVTIKNAIPLGSGLGAEAAFSIAGVLGASALLGDLYDREEVLELAAEISTAAGVAASLSGGLALAMRHEDVLLRRSLESAPMTVAIASPTTSSPPSPPDLTPPARHGLIVEALRAGDLSLLGLLTQVISLPDAYASAAEAARRRGAKAIVASGPALIAFADANHEAIAETMGLAFKGAGLEARTWALPVDTQGIVISAMQSV
jgi:homoserine kinase